VSILEVYLRKGQ
jgi:hypothetical protein